MNTLFGKFNQKMIKEKNILSNQNKKNAVFFAFFIYIFSVSYILIPQQSSAQLKDVIGVRVMKNDQFLSPSAWYLQNVPNPGSPKTMQIDGYEAVVDGRTVYVNATRVNVVDANTKPYIYIMSYNEGAGASMLNIFNQLLDNWSFNSNIPSADVCEKLGVDGDIECVSDFDCIISNTDYGPCLSTKGKLRRDVKRITDLQNLKKELESYSATHSTFPSLVEGTYIPRYSTSKWPSWNDNLSKQLGIKLPADPINRFYSDCSTLPGYHPDTCWNESIKSFKCPSGALVDATHDIYSYLYVYSAKGICSMHCDEPVCFDSGAITATTCKNLKDCTDASLTGPCQFNPANTCTKNSDCPNAATGEYCMKTNSLIDIQFNLETSKDTKISTEYPLDTATIGISPVTGGICNDSDFFAMQPLNITDIDCCPPLNCADMGDTGYTCGKYTNSCGESITCSGADTDASGKCTAPGSKCSNGSCCTPNCTGKVCGDDGCGGTCGSCATGSFCTSSNTCQLEGSNACSIGDSKCSVFGNWIQLCGNCDTDPWLDWCDDTNCAVQPPPITSCAMIGGAATCTQCTPGALRSCGNNIGVCSIGTQTCEPSGNWGICSGSTVDYEAVEVTCDSKDNDCDGSVDEDNICCGVGGINIGEICDGNTTSCNAVCGEGFVAGTKSCNATCDGWDTCIAITPPIADESLTSHCDGLDNDCDGLIDENNVCCGNGILDPGEFCEGTLACVTSFTAGLPAHCAGIPMEGTKTCNNACNGWVDGGTDAECVVNPPSLVSDSYGSCNTNPTYIYGKSCCELTGCNIDGCCGGSNLRNATLSSGYTFSQNFAYGSYPNACILGRNQVITDQWIININHSTAGYRCWD